MSVCSVVSGEKKLHPLFVGGQVVKHHDHNLLVRNAVLMDDLVGMARIGLENTHTTNTLTTIIHIYI